MNQAIDFGLFNYSYQDYLASDLWKARASEYKRKVGFKCEAEGCKHFGAVQIHHLDYSRLGKELDGDLICLCKHHHEKIHKREARECQI